MPCWAYFTSHVVSKNKLKNNTDFSFYEKRKAFPVYFIVVLLYNNKDIIKISWIRD